MTALVRFRENQRHVLRGISFNAEDRAFCLDMEEDETRIVTLNFNDMLATSETITDVTVDETSGLNASVSLNNNTATVTLSGLSSYGDAELLVTRSGGEIFKVYLQAESVINKRRDRHYYWRYA